MMNWPKKGCGVPLCTIYVWLVGCMDPHLGLPDLMTLFWNGFLCQLRGTVLAWAPGSIFTVGDLVPCFVIGCTIMKNVVCPSVAVSVISLPSLGWIS